MADGLPTLADACVQLSMGPGELCVQFPGGVRLCAQYGFDTGDASAITRSLMAQVNSALMPLQPFFMTLDTIKAILDCIQAIPDCILELSPEPVIEKTVKLVQKVEKLLELLPQLSVPVLIKTILQVIVVALIGLRAELAALIAQQARLIAAGLRAQELGNTELQSVVDCATNNLAVQLANHNASMAPLNELMGVINILLQLAGLPKIELLPSLGDELSDDVLSVVDVAVDVLEGVSAALPS